MTFLIKNVQLLGTLGNMDVRLAGDRIAEIGAALPVGREDILLEAGGGLLLPGLHDHHIHLVSLAASLASVHCGPPKVQEKEQLVDLLKLANGKSDDWLRGIGYHNSVAGDIDRHWLDRHIPDRPVRIQHRGGRLWVLNSCALAALDLLGDHPPADLPSGIEYHGNAPSGRLYECDRWLRKQLGSTLPCLAAASELLASRGITGITDTTPSNGPTEWDYFHRMQREGKLQQQVRMMGAANLPTDRGTMHLQSGEFKVHLLESELPEFDRLLMDIRNAHDANRSVAIHCVTYTELVFALTALETAGSLVGDRIEHASVTPLELLPRIAAVGLRVVSQPHFILERGDQYLQDVAREDQPSLYRLQSFIDAGVPLAAGSDAPFGTANPWRAMQAAVNRRSNNGTHMGVEEALTPETSLSLYTSSPESPGVVQRTIEVGGEASLCLLKSPWQDIRHQLDTARVVGTWVRGVLAYNKIT